MSIQVRKRAPLWVFAFHEFQQRIRSVSWRQAISQFIIFFKGKAVTDESLTKESQSLSNDGFLLVDEILNELERGRLIRALSLKMCTDRARPQLGKFTIDEVPNVTHVADINDVMDIPEAIKFANDNKVLQLVETYLGTPSIIDSIKAWWSFPGFDEGENEQFYHRDNDSIKFIKLFMYLTEVTEDCGPHVFIKGSHVMTSFGERRRFLDSEVELRFPPENKIAFLGGAGTCFLEDTFGLHKGMLPTGQKRLLIQVRYSVLPTIFVSKYGADRKECLSEMKNNFTNKYIQGSLK